MNSAHGTATVTAAQAGDERAQDELIAEYLPLVYNIVGRALSGHPDVDDVVQETMLRVIDGLPSLREAGSFRSWLVAVAMNEVRRHQRAHRAEVPCDGLYEAQEVADPAADFVGLTIVRLGLSGQRREVTEATRWLDDTDRELLSLWWLEAAGELSRADVATALEQSQQHVTVRIQRMKTQLETARMVVRALSAVPGCPELETLTATWDGDPGPLWRKRIARHARDCDACGEHRDGLVPAEGLLAGLAVVPLPPHLAAPAAAPAAPPVDAAAPAHQAPVDPGSAGPVDPGSASSLPHGPSVPGHHGHFAGRLSGPGHSAHSGAARLGRSVLWHAGGAPAVPAVLAGVAAVAALACLTYAIPETPAPTDAVALIAPETTAPPAARAATVPEPPAPTSWPPTTEASEPPPPAPVAAPTATPVPAPTTRPPSPSPTPAASRSAARKATTAPPASSPAASPKIAPVVLLSPFEQEVIDLINSERAKAGCAPLRPDPQLHAAAQRHSDDMAARGFFDHASPDGVTAPQRITAAGYRWSNYAENIGYGRSDVKVLVAELMNTPDHRVHILNCAFKDIGVGVRFGPGGPWWTQDFGTPR